MAHYSLITASLALNKVMCRHGALKGRNGALKAVSQIPLFLLHSLRSGPLQTMQFYAVLGEGGRMVQQPCLSVNLAALKKAGLIASHKESWYTMYSITPLGVKTLEMVERELQSIAAAVGGDSGEDKPVKYGDGAPVVLAAEDDVSWDF